MVKLFQNCTWVILNFAGEATSPVSALYRTCSKLRHCNVSHRSRVGRSKSTNYRPSVSQLSADYHASGQALFEGSGDNRQSRVGGQSAHNRSTLTRKSANTRPIVGPSSADNQPIYLPTIDCQPTCPQTVSRYIDRHVKQYFLLET